MTELTGGAPARPVSSGGSGRAPLAAPLPGRWLEKPFPSGEERVGVLCGWSPRVRLSGRPQGEGRWSGWLVDRLWAQSEMYLRGLSPAPEVFSTARGTDVRGW